MSEVKELIGTFGDFKIADHVSLTIPDEKILGLTGQNDAGETTAFRSILNFSAQDSGLVLRDGQPLNEKEYNIIGYLPEERGLCPKITIEDQLIYFTSLRGRTKKEIKPRINFWIGKFQVKDKKTDKARSLSKGNQQEAQLVAILIYEPRLITLDEPFSGLDPVNVELLKDGIIELKNQGSCAIFSDHNMDNVEKTCDHLVMLKNGHMVLDGQVHEIRQQSGRAKLFLEPPLSVEEVAATAGVKEAHLRQGNVLEATLENAEVGKVLLNKATANGYIPMFNQQPPTLEEVFKVKVGEQDK